MLRFLRQTPDAMLSVGMGLSKTAAVLMDIVEKLKSKAIRGVLVLGPRRVINITWPDEIEKWAQFRWLKFANLRTQEGRDDFLYGRAHIYLINYDSMHVLAKMMHALFLCGIKDPFDMVVFDEITKCKSHDGKRISLFNRTVGRVKFQRGLTGTLQPNALNDLFAQYRLLDGGSRLGTHITHFRDRFFDRELNDGGFHTYTAKEGSVQKVAALVADITLTLESKDWLNIPTPFFEDVELELPKSLMKDYRKLERDLVYMLTEETGINVGSLGILVNKLLQFTSGFIYDEEKRAHHIHDIKLTALKKALKQSDGPTLVAVGFTHEMKQLREHLPKAVFVEDFKTPRAERDLIARWNGGTIETLVSHPASISHGLNMQDGGHEILWWSLTHNRDWHDQMNARLARPGQKRHVRIRRLMMDRTIDESVAEALRHKQNEESLLFECMKRIETHNPAKYL